jgi:hypothetical protein
MGAYQCKKCGVPITHHKKNTNSCRIHSYYDPIKKIINGVCKDCDILNNTYGNCAHKYKFKWGCTC